MAEFARAFADEDIGAGDITTAALIDSGQRCEARIVAKQSCVVAGLEIAGQIFKHVCRDLNFTANTKDGARLRPDALVATLHGPTSSILQSERSALNVLQRMCGIATLTNQYVTAVAGTGAEIYDTRKTAPGLRLLDKYAVVCGGGRNHRLDLNAQILIKDNHIKALKNLGMGLAEIVAKARSGKSERQLEIEIEVDTLEMAYEALTTGADILLLDNMRVADVRQVAGKADPSVILEASGGLTLDTVRGYAEAGAKRLAVGALTHSVSAVDIALDIV